VINISGNRYEFGSVRREIFIAFNSAWSSELTSSPTVWNGEPT